MLVGEDPEDVQITVLPAGTQIPDELWFHESPSNFFTLECFRPCTLKDFNKKMNAFMRTLRTISKTEYLALGYK